MWVQPHSGTLPRQVHLEDIAIAHIPSLPPALCSPWTKLDFLSIPRWPEPSVRPAAGGLWSQQETSNLQSAALLLWQVQQPVGLQQTHYSLWDSSAFFEPVMCQAHESAAGAKQINQQETMRRKLPPWQNLWSAGNVPENKQIQLDVIPAVTGEGKYASRALKRYLSQPSRAREGSPAQVMSKLRPTVREEATRPGEEQSCLIRQCTEHEQWPKTGKTRSL